MKRKKKQSKMDFSNMETLDHQPFAQLGAKFNISPNQDGELDSIPEQIQKAKKPQIMIRREKRKGHKWVTAIYHLGDDIKSMLKPLKKRFASGGGIDGEVIVIQGDHLDEIIAWFEQKDFLVRRG